MSKHFSTLIIPFFLLADHASLNAQVRQESDLKTWQEYVNKQESSIKLVDARQFLAINIIVEVEYIDQTDGSKWRIVLKASEQERKLWVRFRGQGMEIPKESPYEKTVVKLITLSKKQTAGRSDESRVNFAIDRLLKFIKESKEMPK